MASPALRSKIDFPANVAVSLALAFADGKNVPSSYNNGGTQVMFSTTDNRCFFLSEAAAASLKKQMADKDIGPGAQVTITKSQTPGEKGKPVTRWLIDKPQSSGKIGQLPDGTFAVERLPDPPDMARLVAAELDKRLGKWQPKPLGSAGTHEPPPDASQIPASGSAHEELGDGGRLEHALILAVTAAHKATLHAKAIGFQMPAFTSEDLRCMANTQIIQGGGR
jgi:hypothetical protein